MPEPVARPAADDAARRLVPGGGDPADVRALFDALPGVAVEELTGRWRGSGLSTGSPLDGLLEAYGWYGKEVVDADRVHPLLFRDRHGRPRPLNPAPLPVGLLGSRPGLARLGAARRAFGLGRGLLWTDRPAARLRTVVHCGIATAAMIYDALPIIDVFKRVDAGTVLGLMDLRGLPDPYFFVLRRDSTD